MNFFVQWYMKEHKIKKIEAIFFDVDDTLFPTTQFHKGASRKGMDEILDMLQDHYYKSITISKNDAYDLVDKTYDAFNVGYRELFKYVLQRLNFEYDLKLDLMVLTILEAKGTYAYHEHELVAMRNFSDVHKSLLQLKQGGYKLGIITNGAALYQAYKFIKLDISHYFEPEYVHISDVIGIRKPDVSIFKAILKKLGLNPHDCVYVGDNAISDIEPAAQVGLITIHIKREGGKHINKIAKRESCFTVNSLIGIDKLLLGGKCKGKDICDNFQCPIKQRY